ncbi:MAG: restriction endonuclease subunit S, partial [Steroidobacter sp.]
MRFQSYPKYKPSGVEWLGDVPEHWITWKSTHGFGLIGSGTTPKSDDAEYYDGTIPWVTTSELRETVIRDTSAKVTESAIRDYQALRLYAKGTLLFAMYGATIGRLGILGIAATVNQACAALAKPIHLETYFVYYWLQMRRRTLVVLSAGGGQPNLSQQDIRQLRIPAPQLSEQRAIADFL